MRRGPVVLQAIQSDGQQSSIIGRYSSPAPRFFSVDLLWNGDDRRRPAVAESGTIQSLCHCHYHYHNRAGSSLLLVLLRSYISSGRTGGTEVLESC